MADSQDEAPAPPGDPVSNALRSNALVGLFMIIAIMCGVVACDESSQGQHGQNAGGVANGVGVMSLPANTAPVAPLPPDVSPSPFAPAPAQTYADPNPPGQKPDDSEHKPKDDSHKGDKKDDHKPSDEEHPEDPQHEQHQP